MESTRKPKIKDLFFLHILLLLYSLGGIFSKLASQQKLFSFEFLLFYGIVLFNLFIYAILWQQILKRMPLTTAFSNKSIVIVWGMLWGAVFFKEEISIFMLIGATLIIFGVYLVVTDYD